MTDEKKAALDNLKKVVKEELYKCIRCGECRTVCPVFRETPAERYTARGKMQIAEALAEGRLEFTEHVREALDNCLLCTFQPLLFRGVPGDSGLYRRFAMPAVDERQYIPRLAAVPFRKRVKFAGKAEWPAVTFFTGCMTSYAMTEIGDSMVKVFNALEIAVRVPSEQGCCGMPMLISGDRAAVRKAAERNVRALAASGPEEPIIVVCASGGHMLRHGYHELFGDDPELGPLLEGIAARTMDVTEYLAARVGVERIAALVGEGPALAVTWHDPCHLRKAQKLTREPRAVLAAAARSPVREMAHPEACCGLGGTYCLTHMDLSKRIQTRKIEDAAASGADCIATACPGCIMQLRDGVRRGPRPDMQVKHVIQILAEAL